MAATECVTEAIFSQPCPSLSHVIDDGSASDITDMEIVEHPSRFFASKPSLQTLNFDASMAIVQYMNAIDMFRLEGTCKYFNEFFIPEHVWQELCIRRWRVNEKAAKVVGAAHWKYAYAILQRRKKLPKGSYTDSQRNATFGFGRAGGCDCWILIGHRPNTAANQILVRGQQVRSIEFRVCFQNVYNGKVTLNLNETLARFHHLDDQYDLKEAETLNHKIIALNGNRVAVSDPVVTLKQLEFAVISFDVICPRDVYHETDLLSMSRKLTVHWDLCDRCDGRIAHAHDRTSSLRKREALTPANYKISKVICKFIDEAQIWDLYTELPGNVVLLRSESDFNVM
jgi:hypothetical protein